MVRPEIRRGGRTPDLTLRRLTAAISIQEAENLVRPERFELPT